MKVILLKDDKKLGKKGDIVNASDGFAFNNLIPRGIAKAATTQVLKEVERQQQRVQQELETLKTHIRSQAKELNKKKITIHAQAKGDKLFGSVTAKDIAENIRTHHGCDVTEKSIMLQSPIKELTSREIGVDFGHGITAHVIVTIAAK
jgi:large subunit ribosomal protein L9